MPDPQAIYEVVEATWAPARTEVKGPFTLRDGRGGGKRVSAATAQRLPDVTEIPTGERAMLALGQTPLFMIRQGDGPFDALLARQGYAIIDPVTIYQCPIDVLTALIPPRLSTFAVWPPLAIGEEIWAQGGIDTPRLAVMHRTQGPKTTILGRVEDHAAAIAFVAIHKNTAMLHALEVAPEHRRKGVAQNVMAAAAIWAKSQGAKVFSVVTTRENLPANRLYASLNMDLVGEYHYRIKTL